jgi:hypothetical protein
MTLSKRTRLRLALVIATALLIAQFGAQAHAYSHIHASSVATEQLGSHDRLCTQCLSFAPLLATAGTPSHLFAIVSQGIAAAPGVAVASLITEPAVPSFQSRAPPRPR